MINPIQWINSAAGTVEVSAENSGRLQGDGGSFGRFLEKSINEVNRLQTESDQSVKDLATGRETDLHRTMISMEKASVAFELMMQVRNKVISAYEEISRMQI